MKKESRQFLLATAMLVGTVIGVGIFSVPYAVAQVGLWGALAYFAVLGGINLLQHLFFAEAAIAEPAKLRMVGLVEKYLGRRWKGLAAASTVLGYWGGLLAYMIVGGSFLHVLLSPYLGGTPAAYQLGWALAAAGLTWFGLRVIARLDFVATVGLVAALGVILAACAGKAKLANLAPLPPGDLFLPYGVILFSLSGLPAITEMEDIFEGRHRHYRAAVVTGTVIAWALTLAFGLLVWSASGAGVTRDAVTGLSSVLGPGVQRLAAAFGFLAVYTSYFATAVNLQSTFEYDYAMPHWRAWLLTGAVPLAALLAGTKDFVAIVSFSGAVFGGVSAVLVAALYVAVKRRGAVKAKPLGAPLWTAYASMAVLAAGAAYETWHAGAALLR